MLAGLAAAKQLVPSADVSADEAASISISLAFGNGYALGLNYAPAVQGPTDGDSALNASIATAFAHGSGFAVGGDPVPTIAASADEKSSIATAYGAGHGYFSNQNAAVSDDDVSGAAAFAYGLGYASYGGKSVLPVIEARADELESISQSYAAGERAFAELTQKSSTEKTPPMPVVKDAATPTETTPTETTLPEKIAQKKPLSVQSKLAHLEADLAIENPPKALMKRLQLIEETFYGEGHKGKGPVKARVEQLWNEMY